MPKVLCNVANCTYWAEGNECSANEILVEIDQHGSKNVNEEFGSIAGEANHEDYARTNSGTCCYTFEQR